MNLLDYECSRGDGKLLPTAFSTGRTAIGELPGAELIEAGRIATSMPGTELRKRPGPPSRRSATRRMVLNDEFVKSLPKEPAALRRRETARHQVLFEQVKLSAGQQL